MKLRQLRRLLLITVVLLIGASALLNLKVFSPEKRPAERADGRRFHFAMVMQEIPEDELEEALGRLREQWNIWVEVHTFETVADQKSMLRLLADTGVDGVLLWPISENEEDYSDELKVLTGRSMPVIIVERNVAPMLRSSYIGSGFSSDSLVLEQTLHGLEENDRFLVGNRFGSGAGQVIECLLFSKNQTSADLDDLRNVKLRQMAADPPEGYTAEAYFRIEGDAVHSIDVRERFRTILKAFRPALVFSLDDAFTSVVISAEREAEREGEEHITLLGYGDREQFEHFLREGVLDGLVCSRPVVSATIGLRYLLDLSRGMWVPASMDSGIDFLRRQDLR